MFRATLLAGCLALTGCLTTPTTRSQSEDLPEAVRPDVVTIDMVAAFANTQPVAVSGVGLVTNLDGTGGPQPPGTYRSMLETELKRRQIPNAREILDSKNHAVVLVSAILPPGVRKGDPVDVIVELPPQSPATSLRGGYLCETSLMDYNTTGNLNPQATAAGKGDRLLLGDTLVKVEGPLVFAIAGKEPRDLESPDAPEVTAPTDRRAFVWGTGRAMKDRPLFLSMNLDSQRARVASQVAERINQTFHVGGAGSERVATAKTKEIVSVIVPPQYRLNIFRFMRVIGKIPVEYMAENSPYRYKLEEQVLDPTLTLAAAVRLEAIGGGTVPDALKPALQSAYPVVRFAAAESLCYLGQTDGATELGQLAAEQPSLSAYCLTALASLDEGKCLRELMGLLNHETPEVRYGAFRALRALDERSEFSRGERLGGTFYMHRVAPQSPALVHLLASHRPEVVVFGDTPTLKGPFTYVVGPEFTVTASDNDPKVTISRFSVAKGKLTKQCAYDVAAVTRTLAEMGGNYNDVCDLLRQADACKSLSCPLAVDAMPKVKTVQDLAQLGATSANLRESAIPGDELAGETPNIFK